jgi:RND family efflux transporter MFP subunit
LNRAKAQLEESKAGLTQATANLGQAEAQVNKGVAGLDYQHRRLDRSKQLLPGNIITQEEFDLQKSEMLQATADLEAAKAQVGASQSAIGTSKANVQASEAAVAVAELNLKYTNVLAPVSGRVSRTMVTEGNLVQSGDQTGGTLLTTLVSVDPMYAYFDVDEATVLRVRKLIREGKVQSARDSAVSVLLGLGSDTDFPQKGTIDFVDNQVNPRTGTLRLRGIFPNPNEVLAPGYFARVRLPIGAPHQALLIDERALDSDQGQKIVYVVNDQNQVAARPVSIGERHDGLVSVDYGLKSGERVVVNGLQQIRPGSTVVAKLVDMPTAIVNSEPATPPRVTSSKPTTAKPAKS